MDWSALLGALIGASAGILGSFISTWAQFRKDRLAFNRDKVITVAFRYLHDCDKALAAQKSMAVSMADYVRHNYYPEYKFSPDEVAAAGSALETVRTSLAEMSFYCPRASKETHALFDAAANISTDDVVDSKYEDVDGQSQFRLAVDGSVDGRYMEAKADFIDRIRKLADL